jgi:hypothetical protein
VLSLRTGLGTAVATVYVGKSADYVPYVFGDRKQETAVICARIDSAVPWLSSCSIAPVLAVRHDPRWDGMAVMPPFQSSRNIHDGFPCAEPNRNVMYSVMAAGGVQR